MGVLDELAGTRTQVRRAEEAIGDVIAAVDRMRELNPTRVREALIHSGQSALAADYAVRKLEEFRAEAAHNASALTASIDLYRYALDKAMDAMEPAAWRALRT